MVEVLSWLLSEAHLSMRLHILWSRPCHCPLSLESCISPLCYIISFKTCCVALHLKTKYLCKPMDSLPSSLFQKENQNYLFIVSISSPFILYRTLYSQVAISTNPWLLLCQHLQWLLCCHIKWFLFVLILLSFLAAFDTAGHSLPFETPSSLRCWKLLSLFSIYLPGHYFSFSLAGSPSSSWPPNVAVLRPLVLKSLLFLHSFPRQFYPVSWF